ncbi:MAG: large conductance mechanosensitive channel protein MscL [Flavipsychrobacter sp.]
MSLLKEFKAFATKGNVVDLAVAVVIGGAFGAIVKSLVADLIMPLVGMITGGSKISARFLVLEAGKEGDVYTSLAQAKDAGANVLAYGNFIQSVVDFLLIAFSIFMVIRVFNKLKKKEEEKPAAPPEPSSTDKLLMEIRDSLKK